MNTLPDSSLTNLIQAAGTLALVVVTSIYAYLTHKIANQARSQSDATYTLANKAREQADATFALANNTKEQAAIAMKLLEEQEISRWIPFVGRQLHELYNPLIYSIDEALKLFGPNKLEVIYNKLAKTQEEVLYKYSYMLPPNTYVKVVGLFGDLHCGSMDENNGELSQDEINNIHIEFDKIRKLLHEQRTELETYVRKNNLLASDIGQSEAVSLRNEHDKK